MKTLKEYITEGILDIEDNINIDTSDMTKDVIEQFLKENYNIVGSYTIKETKNGFMVNAKDYVSVKNKNITSLTNGLFEFGKVGNDFFCDQCSNLTTLEGSPQKVGKDFYCRGCNSLTSLKGAPQKVGWSFYCIDCDSLASLKGAPKEVGRDFYCRGCKSLKSLKGAPQKVGGSFYCVDCSTQFTQDDVRKYTTVAKNIYSYA